MLAKDRRCGDVGDCFYQLLRHQESPNYSEFAPDHFYHFLTFVSLHREKRRGTLRPINRFWSAYMTFHMNFETNYSRVAFSTVSKSAGKRFLACMSDLMSLQMPLCDELVIANDASEGTLTCVCAHVGLEVSYFFKLF